MRLGAERPAVSRECIYGFGVVRGRAGRDKPAVRICMIVREGSRKHCLGMCRRASDALGSDALRGAGMLVEERNACEHVRKHVRVPAFFGA